MSDFIKVGRLQIDSATMMMLDGMTFAEFKKLVIPHYKKTPPDKKDEVIKNDYEELKKHFTKKKKEKQGD